MQKRVTFKTRQGFELSGVLHKPDHTVTVAYALFAHCFTCTKNINSAVNIADAMASEGIATLRFDFTGLGASKGEFADTSFSTDVNDLIDAAEFLEAEYEAPQILVGHSLGGTAILAAAKDIPSAKAVATIASPSSPEHVLHQLEPEIEKLKEKGEVTIELAGRQFTFKQDFVDDVKSHDIDIHGLRKALMVMHSPVDEVVPIDEAETIYKKALHPKSFITLDSADHLLSDKKDSLYAGHVLASWARRYINAKELPSLESKNEEVVVASRAAEGFLSYVNANGHELLADEPEKVGGTNLGPSPYDLLSAALGTCTAMTLNMYARHKELDVSNVVVNVSHGKVHAKDCEDCEDKKVKIDKFTRSIRIEADITDDQRQRLLEIADRCPVHQTLHKEVAIETKLEELEE
ncbi:bifunctional alpha/beta hydrolase/OsmC family protein [Kangiella sediminilitoris]|uniref:Osmotically inducible protein C n=1 Tax=Kangiella sediminilitoris TaxID=1144748 RepID=A0A1B3BCK2_9GAMM|nr:bifunctional alpha/beta hydrolase/OsmC family protein [Kangiella sediminilitoris]AOE50540.1 osmotically inducible protein C [Kangiella sediminilitoris]